MFVYFIYNNVNALLKAVNISSTNFSNRLNIIKLEYFACGFAELSKSGVCQNVHQVYTQCNCINCQFS